MRLSAEKCYNVTMLHRKRVEGVFLLYIYYILIYSPYIPQNRGNFVVKNGVIFGKRGQKTEKTERKVCDCAKKGV